jgi:tRNA dimethylallyltransferase
LVKDFRAFWICREKEELELRIEERVEAMFAQGWVEEVRGLMEKHGEEEVRGFAGIGYREIAGMVGEETAGVKRDIKVATRQYAKRQLTWFAREPNLQKVMLNGTQSILAAMPALL